MDNVATAFPPFARSYASMNEVPFKLSGRFTPNRIRPLPCITETASSEYQTRPRLTLGREITSPPTLGRSFGNEMEFLKVFVAGDGSSCIVQFAAIGAMVAMPS